MTMRPANLPPSLSSSRHTVTLVAVLAVLLGALALPQAGAAKTPCSTQLINDWYDGRIDKAYSLACYKQALSALPEDVEIYSSAREDIQRALFEATRKTGKPPTGAKTLIQPPKTQVGNRNRPTVPEDQTPAPTPTPKGTPPTPPPATTTATTTTPRPATPVQTTEETETTDTEAAGSGPIDTLFDQGRPERADSIPVPLLVLAGLALLLLAAGAAGFIARRLQARRVPLPGDETQL